MEGRKFTEKEASEIVRRAAQIQGQSSPQAEQPTVPFEELERIASEAGIDKAVLQQAVLESSAPISAVDSKCVTRIVPGELDPDEFDIIWDSAGPKTRRAYVSQVGRSMQGHLMQGILQCQLNVTSRDGATRISLRKTKVGVFMMTAYPFLLVGFMIAVNLAAHGMAPIAILVFAIASILAGALFWTMSQKQDAKVEELANRMAEAVRELVARRTLASEAQAVRQNLEKPAPQQNVTI